MTEKEQLILSDIAGVLTISVIAGVAFGIWQDSVSAGVFMTMFTLTMQQGES